MKWRDGQFVGHDKACHTCAYMRWGRPRYVEDGKVPGARTQVRSMVCMLHEEACETARAPDGRCAAGEWWVAREA